jgi:hypothetical protein
MSLNNGVTADRQRIHDELDQLVEAYKAAGNSISRSATKVTVVCRICGFRRYIDLRWGFAKGCMRCGTDLRARPLPTS